MNEYWLHLYNDVKTKVDDFAVLFDFWKEGEASEEEAKEASANGSKSLLNDAIRGQLKGIFERMATDVTLVSIVDESMPKSVELRDFLAEIAELGDKVHLELHKKGENTEVEEKIHADKYPVVALLNHSGEYSGVKFHGVPGGHELNSFILAIYNLAGPGQAIDADIAESIKAIDKNINIKVMVSLACHYCPDVVVSAQRIAIMNKQVEAEMVDISQFPELKTKYKVRSVPAMIINDQDVIFGAKKINEIIEAIQ